MHFSSFGEPVFYIIVGNCPELYRLRLEVFPGITNLRSIKKTQQKH
jgi:hypothetical protein